MRQRQASEAGWEGAEAGSARGACAACQRAVRCAAAVRMVIKWR